MQSQFLSQSSLRSQCKMFQKAKIRSGKQDTNHPSSPYGVSKQKQRPLPKKSIQIKSNSTRPPNGPMESKKPLAKIKAKATKNQNLSPKSKKIIVAKPNPKVTKSTSKVVRPNPQVVRPNPRAVRPNPKVVRPNPNIVRPNPKVVRPNPKVAKSNLRVIKPNTKISRNVEKRAGAKPKRNKLLTISEEYEKEMRNSTADSLSETLSVRKHPIGDKPKVKRIMTISKKPITTSTQLQRPDSSRSSFRSQNRKSEMDQTLMTNKRVLRKPESRMVCHRERMTKNNVTDNPFKSLKTASKHSSVIEIKTKRRQVKKGYRSDTKLCDEIIGEDIFHRMMDKYCRNRTHLIDNDEEYLLSDGDNVNHSVDPTQMVSTQTCIADRGETPQDSYTIGIKITNTEWAGNSSKLGDDKNLTCDPEKNSQDLAVDILDSETDFVEEMTQILSVNATGLELEKAFKERLDAAGKLLNETNDRAKNCLDDNDERTEYTNSEALKSSEMKLLLPATCKDRCTSTENIHKAKDAMCNCYAVTHQHTCIYDCSAEPKHVMCQTTEMKAESNSKCQTDRVASCNQAIQSETNGPTVIDCECQWSSEVEEGSLSRADKIDMDSIQCDVTHDVGCQWSSSADEDTNLVSKTEDGSANSKRYTHNLDAECQCPSLNVGSSSNSEYSSNKKYGVTCNVGCQWPLKVEDEAQMASEYHGLTSVYCDVSVGLECQYSSPTELENLYQTVNEDFSNKGKEVGVCPAEAKCIENRCLSEVSDAFKPTLQTEQLDSSNHCLIQDRSVTSTAETTLIEPILFVSSSSDAVTVKESDSPPASSLPSCHCDPPSKQCDHHRSTDRSEIASHQGIISQSAPQTASPSLEQSEADASADAVSGSVSTGNETTFTSISSALNTSKDAAKISEDVECKSDEQIGSEKTLLQSVSEATNPSLKLAGDTKCAPSEQNHLPTFSEYPAPCCKPALVLTKMNSLVSILRAKVELKKVVDLDRVREDLADNNSELTENNFLLYQSDPDGSGTQV